MEEVPKGWSKSIICPICKKGDLMECHNYIGISLPNTAYKMLLNISLRQFHHMQKKLSEVINVDFERTGLLQSISFHYNK
jgi:hypothetical protein